MGREGDGSRVRTCDHRFFLTLLIVNIVLGRIAMRCYGEEFTLFHDAISDLGATHTRNGAVNSVSPYLFTLQMVASAFVMHRFARHLRTHGADPGSAEVRLAQLATVGFLIMPAPHNVPTWHSVHMLGAGFVIFALWVYGMRYLLRCRDLGMLTGYRLGMLVLQAGVLTYALLFALNSPHKQVAQAAAVFSVCVTISVSTVVLARHEAGIRRGVTPAEGASGRADAESEVEPVS